MSLAVVMITFNEEFHIGDAIDNVKKIADEIYILDSLSTDKTVDIALAKGAVVLQRPFTNFGDQWNFALTHFPIKSKWTMKMDPDERLSDNLKNEITDIIFRDNVLFDSYCVDIQLYFMNKQLRFCYIKKLVRLWKTNTCFFSNVAVNEHLLTNDKIGKLESVIYHLDCVDLHKWFDKQNTYTSMEALMRYRKDKLSVEPKLWGNSLERRMFLKTFFYRRFPFKFFLLWFYFFFVKKAFLSGALGWHWANCRVFISRLIELKWKEMEYTSRKIIIPVKQIGLYNPAVLQTELQQSIMNEL